MFNVLFTLGILFVVLAGLGALWVNVIHPFLFDEALEDKLDDAVEQKVMSEADKKVDEILKEEV